MFAARALPCPTPTASGSTITSVKSSFSRRLSSLKVFKLLCCAPSSKTPALTSDLRLLLAAQAQAHPFTPANPAPYNPLVALDAMAELEFVKPLPACFIPVIMVSTSTSFHSLSSIEDAAVVLKKPALTAEVDDHLLTVPAPQSTVKATRRRRTASTRKTARVTRARILSTLHDEVNAFPPTSHVAQGCVPIIVRASDVLGKSSLLPESIRAGLSSVAEPKISVPWWANLSPPTPMRAAPPTPVLLYIGMPSWNSNAHVPHPRPLLSAHRAAFCTAVAARMHERKAGKNIA
jgi:hypothetical protein